MLHRAVAGVLLILFGTLVFMRYKNMKSDEIWSVHVEELHLDDPVEVIGQGSFGVVLLAGMWEKKAGCRSNSSVADALILFPLQM